MMGEFRASNGGSLVRAEVSLKTQDIDKSALFAYDGTALVPESNEEQNFLEPIVEQESEVKNKKPAAWNPKHLEYGFSVKVGNNELKAVEYSGDQLDWYNFRISNSNVRIDGTVTTRSVAPQPISFKGMPNSRWWEFEDSSVDLGAIRRPNLNFLSMLLTNYALIYSNDWFIIPITQKTGTIRQITKLDVIDSFGFTELIRPIAPQANQANRWSMFTLSGDGTISPTEPDILLLPNTVSQQFNGEPLEEITLFRDELANLVWAVENKCYSDDRKVINRDDEIVQDDSELPQSDIPLYRLISHVQKNWIPYIPKQIYSNNLPTGEIYFLRARTDAGATNKEPQYQGKIIGESKIIFEEEVPATPIKLTRSYKMLVCGPDEWKLSENNGKYSLIRTRKKKLVLWLGRNKKITSKRGYSNLKFDYLVEK